MGLDIYFSGRITPGIAPVGETFEPLLRDGYEVEEIRVRLGHWRKDWHLQNFMSQRYPDDFSSTYEMSFSADGLREILGEIQSGGLKEYDDEPYPVEAFERTVETLQRAIEWVESAPDSEWRDVIYWASW